MKSLTMKLKKNKVKSKKTIKLRLKKNKLTQKGKGSNTSIIPKNTVKTMITKFNNLNLKPYTISNNLRRKINQQAQIKASSVPLYGNNNSSQSGSLFTNNKNNKEVLIDDFIKLLKLFIKLITEKQKNNISFDLPTTDQIDNLKMKFVDLQIDIDFLSEKINELYEKINILLNINENNLTNNNIRDFIDYLNNIFLLYYYNNGIHSEFQFTESIKLFNIGQSYEVPVPVQPHIYENVGNLTATTPNIYENVGNNLSLSSLKPPPLPSPRLSSPRKK